jgi:hypothetical protein
MTANVLLPDKLLALKEQARRQRDEGDRARRRESQEAAEANWRALTVAVRDAVPSELLLFALGIDAMPSSFCGHLNVFEVTFRVPGHVPLTARFERGNANGNRFNWTRRTVDSGRLPLDAPNAEGRPQWRVGPFRAGHFRHAVTLGEALLAAELVADAGDGIDGGIDGLDDDGSRLNLGALANGEDDSSIPF